MTDENKKNTFVKITNQQVWESFQEVKEKLDTLEIQFVNHLSHHKKFESNMKWAIPLVMAFVTFLVQMGIKFWG